MWNTSFFRFDGMRFFQTEEIEEAERRLRAYATKHSDKHARSLRDFIFARNRGCCRHERFLTARGAEHRAGDDVG